MRIGWTTLLFFMGLGLVLESMHAFKLGFYLGVGLETRRMMWSLAHAHGALIGLVHLAFAAHAPRLPLTATERSTSSRLFVAATVLLPGGFFAGGIDVRGSDPGVGVLLAPIGALLLIAATALVARASFRPPPEPPASVL